MFLLLLGLKLTGHIDWSWWVVFIPFAIDLIGVAIDTYKEVDE